MSEVYDKAFWDARYGEKESIWSGNPNPVLVSEISSLTPGTALDIGCGEGADAIWLASRGWQVTAADISTVALERAASRTADTESVAARIRWEQHDFLEWSPPVGAFDLVSSQFMHLSAEQNARLFRALAAAVAPGGTLLIVGHDPSDTQHGGHDQSLLDMKFTAAFVEALLDASEWEIRVSEARARQVLMPDGYHHPMKDAVLLARKL